MQIGISTASKVDSDRIGLAGYSFGTMVALPVALRSEQVRAIALVSPIPSAEDWQKLKGYVNPKLFLSGNRDAFIPSKDIYQRAGELPEPNRCEIIPGADHFWWGFEQEVAGKVSTFFVAVFQK